MIKIIYKGVSIGVLKYCFTGLSLPFASIFQTSQAFGKRRSNGLCCRCEVFSFSLTRFCGLRPAYPTGRYLLYVGFYGGAESAVIGMDERYCYAPIFTLIVFSAIILILVTHIQIHCFSGMRNEIS